MVLSVIRTRGKHFQTKKAKYSPFFTEMRQVRRFTGTTTLVRRSLGASGARGQFGCGLRREHSQMLRRAVPLL